MQEECSIARNKTRNRFHNFDMTLECMVIGDRIAGAVARGCRNARNYIDFNPEFRHEAVDVSLPMRMVSWKEYEEAVETVASIKALYTNENSMTMEGVVRAFELQGIVLRWELQQKTQEFCFKMHVLRIGNIAIATNPFELYSEFGMRMKLPVAPTATDPHLPSAGLKAARCW